jgi:hypothetical protein
VPGDRGFDPVGSAMSTPSPTIIGDPSRSAMRSPMRLKTDEKLGCAEGRLYL